MKTAIFLFKSNKTKELASAIALKIDLTMKTKNRKHSIRTSLAFNLKKKQSLLTSLMKTFKKSMVKTMDE